jgi:hypothetical protein
VAFAWVFFKASSLENALSLLSRLATQLGQFNLSWLYLWLFSILFIFLSKNANLIETKIIDLLSRIHFWLLIPVLCALGYLLIELSPEGIPSFIYYQF